MANAKAVAGLGLSCDQSWFRTKEGQFLSPHAFEAAFDIVSLDCNGKLSSQYGGLRRTRVGFWIL